jgi:hypothetical protein
MICPSHNDPNEVRYGFVLVKVSMPAAYSYDLRKKAMEALDEGESRATVAKRFKIGKTTLYEWQKRREAISSTVILDIVHRLGYLLKTHNVSKTGSVSVIR